ncbi:hypothetical protein [Flavobacterium sp.]|uniref:hypothetical protein n=1 Tax=Flavobacterium sp. TaxID=239 RepID=UPI0026150A58|nr:hypothetical protein [Flavobacterium sp.]
MKTLLHFIDKVQHSKVINALFLGLTLLAFALGSTYLFTRPMGSGDEALFLDNFEFLKINGWSEAIASKIPLTYFILVYPFALFIKPYLAFRLVNCLLFVLLLFYFYKKGFFKQLYFLTYFIFFSSTAWFLIGTNDPLFIIAIVVFFTESYLLIEKKNYNVSLLFSALIVAFFTRELIYIYIPVLVFTFYLLYKSGIQLGKSLLVPGVLFLVLLAINIPSIQKNHSLSYDDKTPPKELACTWTQRQYLAQLLVNQGKLPNHQHPSFEETIAYLKANGEDSLPKTISESLTFDYQLTIKEFFKDFIEVLFYSIRNTGLIVFFVLLVPFLGFKKSNFMATNYLPIVVFLVLAIFSFIIISYVEGRWLVPVYLMAIVFFCDKIVTQEKYKVVVFLNNIIIVSVLFFGIYRILPKLF